MIVVDIETTGIYPEKHGIWQIGALDYCNPQNTFLEEARIDKEDEIAEEALRITGKTESYLRDNHKQSQKQLLENFFYWIKETSTIKNAICQNPQFDLGFINYKARKYRLKSPLHYRSLDLHSIASARYFKKNNNFLLDGDHSGMSLTQILEFCGLEDKRISLSKGEIIKEGTPHNALEDAKLTAECFSRLLEGKLLLTEFSKYKIPKYLQK